MAAFSSMIWKHNVGTQQFIHHAEGKKFPDVYAPSHIQARELGRSLLFGANLGPRISRGRYRSAVSSSNLSEAPVDT
jgi:hypothetical protein